jgi:type VI secretion system protein ImpJ
MLLTPQHFQQGDRYLENLISRRIRGVQPYDWGLINTEIDTAALSGGELALKECAGVLPNGTYFDLPHMDKLPGPRAIEAYFPAGSDSLGVYLALARATPGEVTCSPPDSGGDAATTYDGERIKVRDETDKSKEREIVVARKSLCILFEGEPMDAFSAVRIAELQRTSNGGFELNNSYIPPSIFVEASSTLMSVLRHILDILARKSEDLSGQRRQRSKGLVEFTMSEAANFWFLHTINGHLPAVTSAYKQPRLHPRELYQELAGLTGELYTFSSEGHPRDIPEYKHEDLTGTFAKLVHQLRKLLATVLPTKCAPVPLERVQEAVYMARFPDERVLATRLYLAVKANVPEERIVAELPAKSKLASADQLNNLISKALPGIQIRYLQNPPKEIPMQPGRVYFGLGQAGQHWDAVKASKTLAFYVPVAFGGMELELMSVTD